MSHAIIKCGGCWAWENAIYTGCMFTPTLPNNKECPCVECVVKIMCDENSRKTCTPFSDYLKEAEPIIYG